MPFSSGWIRRDLQRRQGLAKFVKSYYAKPLAVITTPGHLQIRARFAWKLERPRRRGLARLGPPLYLSPLAKVTTPGHLQVKERLAVIPRIDGQRRRDPHSKLRRPTAISSTSGGLFTLAADGPSISLTPERAALYLRAAGGVYGGGPVAEAVLTRPLRVLAQMIG